MSGHSKWATTKHKKAAIDAKRGKLFAKLIKNIEIAAKMGGPDLTGNPTLFDAIQKAKKQSVPNKNIDSAVKRGGGLEAPGSTTRRSCTRSTAPPAWRSSSSASPTTGTAPRWRSAPRVTRNGGTLADPGSVSRLFTRKGVDRGAEDAGGPRGHRGRRARGDPRRRRRGRQRPGRVLRGHLRGDRHGRRTHVRCRPPAIDYDSADVEFVPSMEIPVDKDAAVKVLQLADALEDLDDVQNVFTNVDIPDEVLAQLDDERVTRRSTASRACRTPIASAAQVSVGPNRRSDEKADFMRVLGIDPGLTRCGVGVVEGSVGRPLTLIDVDVIRTSRATSRSRSGW